MQGQCREKRIREENGEIERQQGQEMERLERYS